MRLLDPFHSMSQDDQLQDVVLQLGGEEWIIRQKGFVIPSIRFTTRIIFVMNKIKVKPILYLSLLHPKLHQLPN